MKIIEAIGNTPLIQLKKIGGGKIYAKLEKNNPGGSIKDRPALYMIREAIKKGDLREGMTIVEPTSGNTGIGLAWIGRALGFPVVITMPASMSVERRKMLKALGADLILTGEGGMGAAVKKAQELAKGPGYYLPDQFNNPANPLSHYETTGPEIYRDLPEVCGFVTGFGSGGTVSGVGKYLKEKNPKIQIWAMEPAESPLLTQGMAGPHELEGIGANFVPGCLNQELIDHFLTVPTKKAEEMTRRLAQEEGLACGISSGANLVAALEMAKKISGPIVTVLPDSAGLYLSTDLFEEEAHLFFSK